MSLSWPSIRIRHSTWSVAFLALLPVLMTSPALADECSNDMDCGHGFKCETVFGTPTTGAGGAAGAEGISQDQRPAAGRGTAPPPTPLFCDNGTCDLDESPETCPNDCVSAMACVGALCTDSTQCAAGYVCPPLRTISGGATNHPYCGNMVCERLEEWMTCPIDCDAGYRRCQSVPPVYDCLTGCPPDYYCENAVCVPSCRVFGCPPGTICTGSACARENYPTGGTTGAGGSQGSNTGERHLGVNTTSGGCSVSRSRESSFFAACLIAGGALLCFSRRRAARRRRVLDAI
jgi:hypothetical protein